MFPAKCSDGVVGDSSDPYGAFTLEPVAARRGNAEHVNVDTQTIHMLDSALDVSSLKGRGIDPAFKLLVIEVHHAAVRIGLFQDHGPIELFQLRDVRFGKNVRLKINNHDQLEKGA